MGYLLKEPATLMSSDLDDYRDDVIASLPEGSAKMLVAGGGEQ